MYLVGYIDNDREFYEDVEILERFDNKEDAIDCLVQFYIDFLLEIDSFMYIDSGYHMYNYMTKEWIPIDLIFLRKYLKTFSIPNESAIQKYIQDYDKWIKKL